MKRSCNIGFLLTGEHSSYNAAFGLAHVLQERGHNAMFFIRDETIFSQYVDKHGFKAVKMATTPNYQTEKHRKKARLRLWKRLKEHAQNVRLKQDCLGDLIAKNSLDMCFLDCILKLNYPYAVVLAEMRVPTILFNPNFGSKLDSGYPPVFSTMVPPDREAPKIRLRFIYALLWYWAISTMGRAYSYNYFEHVELAFRKMSYRIYNIGFERKLREFGWTSTWSEYSRRQTIPEIVFGHRSIDWHAVASNPKRCYFGTTDHFRKNYDFDWSKIESKAPIVYCSISTAHGFEKNQASTQKGQSKKQDFSKKSFRMAKRFLNVTLDAFSRRKDWQLIIGCGPFYQILQSASYTSNIHIFERVPQLAVLAKADLAITWGGAGTIRECINFGVPMLVFPAWTDQFGNAARVSSRNLGIYGNILDITPKKMIEMVERVLDDKKIRSSVEEMKRQCNVTKEIQELFRFIEHYTALKL